MAPPHAKCRTHQPVTRLRSGYRCSVVRLRLLDKKKAAISAALALAIGTAVMVSTDGLPAIATPVAPVSLPIFGEGVDIIFIALIVALMVIATLTVVLAVRGNHFGRK